MNLKYSNFLYMNCDINLFYEPYIRKEGWVHQYILSNPADLLCIIFKPSYIKLKFIVESTEIVNNKFTYDSYSFNSILDIFNSCLNYYYDY
jgi:hypothetical protein